MTRTLAASKVYAERYEVDSLSSVGKTYIVSRKENGSWGCSCPRWIFHKPRTDCKHILAMILAIKPMTAEVWTMEMTGRKIRGFDQAERIPVSVMDAPVLRVYEGTASIGDEMFTVRRKIRL